MAKVSAADVNKLRKQTGAGMMDCRKALIECDGDFEKAIKFLRKKGQKVAAMRSGRETNEGVVIAKTNAEQNKGIILSVSCETDFVAKNEDFLNFAQAVTSLALDNNFSTLEEVKAAELDGKKVEEQLTELIGKIGEKLTFSHFEKVDADYVASYIHGNYSIGVLVGFSKEIDTEAAQDIAMQIAAMNPVAIDPDGVPQEVIDREKEIATAQIKAEGKPADLAEKISKGKVNKYFKEHTLLSQPFVKDNKQSVADFLKETDAEAKVLSFNRISLS
ncbi:MAG TPA: translation elongation factor Ts [Chitinophagaceae bacterium]|nr:translation elongation factor Ts [Chitinophagaceae bacterium]